MSLPPGFLDELKTRSSLTQIVGRKVTWDQRKSNPAKGDMWAPCPFHQEKTASFHVDDSKGFYYCFGCHEKGDVVSFVQQTENVSFIEAVEVLAREAGMEMPQRDPRAQEKSDRNTRLAEANAAAARFFRMQLATSAGAQARDYLAGRGLDAQAQGRWDIGYAPPGRQVLFAHLRDAGFSPEELAEAGLCPKSDRDGSPYDRFSDRIMFPIRDARDRVIGFGGRAMDPNARAKYLNTQSTPLFDKGRSLYNIGPARAAAGKGAALIVAEGYMDVIALSEHGFPGAVAPLGTAVTEDQLQLLWRIAPEPIVAMDGDRAGTQAALRVIDRALPLLEAGRSLRFARMPEGQDPDDLLRARGAPAVQELLDGAEPIVTLLWTRETEGKTFDSPERRAALDRDLRMVIAKIPDPDLKRHYGEAIKELRWQLFRPKPQARRAFSPGKPAPTAPQPDTRASWLASAQGQEDQLREAVILATCFATPAVIARFEADLERIDFTGPDHAAIAQGLLHFGHDDDPRARVAEMLGPEILESLHAPNHVRISPGVRAAGDVERAALCLAEDLARLAARRGVDRELEEAMADFDAAEDEGLTWRLGQAAQALSGPSRDGSEDKIDYETGANGAAVSKAEKEAFRKLLERLPTSKPSRG